MNNLIDFNEFSSKYRNTAESSSEQEDLRVNEILTEFKNGLCKFHNYSTCIDYMKIRENRKTFGDLLIDKNINEILNKNKIINFNDRLTNVWALQCIGDGNCLVSLK